MQFLLICLKQSQLCSDKIVQYMYIICFSRKTCQSTILDFVTNNSSISRIPRKNYAGQSILFCLLMIFIAEVISAVRGQFVSHVIAFQQFCLHEILKPTPLGTGCWNNVEI